MVAVLGHKKVFDRFISCLDDSIAGTYIHVIRTEDLIGRRFTDIVYLDGWAEAYRSPKEIYLLTKSRLVPTDNPNIKRHE